MAPYPEIFAVCMFLNVVVTSISSSSIQKYIFMLPCFGSYREPTHQNESKPLTEGSDDGVSKIEDQVSVHKKLLSKYLCVYLLAAASDWFQGPYVYALYSAYDFTQHDIAKLFVAGFGSSMIFGCFVGGMADTGGRRRYVVLYAITYAASCLTKREYRDLW